VTHASIPFLRSKIQTDLPKTITIKEKSRNSFFGFKTHLMKLVRTIQLQGKEIDQEPTNRFREYHNV